MYLTEEARPAGEPAKVLDEASKLLLKAASIMEANGWCTGVEIDGGGRLCIAGAINIAAGLPATTLVKDVGALAYDRVGEAVGKEACDWNDFDASSQEEVVSKLRAVALGL